MIGLMFRADARRATLVLVSVLVGVAAVTLQGLWLKLLTDAAADGSTGRAVAAAVALGVFAGAHLLTAMSGFSLVVGLEERVGLHVDQQIAWSTAAIRGIEHLERPDLLAKIDQLETERPAISQSVTGMVGAARIVLTTIGSALLLATVALPLALLPVFGLASVILGSRELELSVKGIGETAEKERLAGGILSLAVQPQSAKEIRVFGLQTTLTERYEMETRDAERRLDRLGLQAAALNALGWTVFAIGYVAAIVFVLQRALDGTATPGDFVLTVLVAAAVNSQVVQSVETVTRLLRSGRVLEQYLWLIDYAGAGGAEVGKEVPPASLGTGIQIDHLSFGYDPDTPDSVLEDITMTLPAGAVVAIVGDNGAGKTTLVKLLTRMYEPTGGRILVDGVDLTAFDCYAWRSRLAGVLQDFTNPEFIVRESVGLGDLPRIENAVAVEAAIDRAGATALVASLDRGLETALGSSFDDGVELSGGQWQAMALARGMMRDSPLLLVLDEPTSALDAETEHMVFTRYADSEPGSRKCIGGHHDPRLPSLLDGPDRRPDLRAGERPGTRARHPSGAHAARRHLPGDVPPASGRVPGSPAHRVSAGLTVHHPVTPDSDRGRARSRRSSGVRAPPATAVRSRARHGGGRSSP